MSRIRRTRSVLCALTAIVLVGAVSVPTSAATIFHPGAPSANDPLVPGVGNGGYDVSHYDITLRYQPSTGLLTGTTTIIATLTQNLSQFNLDFALPATSVSVNARPAKFASQDGPLFTRDREIVVTPKEGLRAGTGMTVVVTYSAKPGNVLLEGFSDWSDTPTGVMVWDEPDPASEWWYPGNDYPSDKATYDVTVTAPAAETVTSNGVLMSRTVHGSQATTHWRSDDPIASYVTVLTIGRYDVVRGTALGNVPTYSAYEQGLGAIGQRARHDVGRTPQVLAFLQSQWGPYPFASAGGIVVGRSFPSALETQTRPIYLSGLWQDNPDNIWAVVHENAHQWFGDSVTMRSWDDIWLAEGFATYSEWVWSQAHGQGSAEQLFLGTYDEYPASDSLWQTPLNRPNYALDLPSYYRGAMLLQALRNRVGSSTFFTIMRTWAGQRRHGNGSTADFEALATNVSAQNLTSFFKAWVDTPKRPAATVANGFPPAAQQVLARGTVRPAASAAAIRRSDAAIVRAETQRAAR